MFWADSGAISATFTVFSVAIDNSQYMAISFDGDNSISTVNMNGVNINGAEFAFSNKVSQITGSASNVTASGLTVASIQGCESACSAFGDLASISFLFSPSVQRLSTLVLG
ncbi:hypothetical protein [Thermogemmatispora sp.]|uniref:hypothetical protein n=1 Tax=Thermogemmatispora sp. TaxID=1968838 RepID=UPI001D516DE3|nr:hypothetical protein [Thermogemmatispora sp.]MBX5450881.1 hypothetical protein [Thermogemmatispora sp.]